MPNAAHCIAFTKRHTSAIAGSYIHESVLPKIDPGIERAKLHCFPTAGIIVEGVGSLVGWALEEVVPPNRQITGDVLVRADGGQIAQENDGYIEEEMAPRGHSEIGSSYSDSEPVCTVCCFLGKLGFRLDMLGDGD